MEAILAEWVGSHGEVKLLFLKTFSLCPAVIGVSAALFMMGGLIGSSIEWYGEGSRDGWSNRVKGGVIG